MTKLVYCDPDQEKPETIESFQDEINRALDNLIKVSGDESVITKWETVVLLKTLADLTRSDAVPLVIQWAGDRTLPEIFV